MGATNKSFQTLKGQIQIITPVPSATPQRFCFKP